ncbi:MAG: acyltransferase family protein, partial [Oscillospiraceae bacterium]|nr:acyltransferase family protein [Oscillospiraceae bacterium]
MQAEMQKSSLEKTARNWNYDAIRLIAGLFVIMVHVADMNYLRADVGSVNWWIHNIYSSAIRCCVPLFVMVSGVFFLDPRRECAIPELFKRNIFKMARLCVFWAVVYQICNIVSAVAGGRTNEITIKWLFDGVVFSKYHLWFLPMICGLYLVTPILRKITGDRSCMEYLLALSFVFSSVLPMLADFPWGGGYIQHWINWVSVQAVMGFSGFFVLGYYLNEYPVAPRVRKVIFLCGVIGALVVTPVGTWIASSMAGKTTQVFYDYQYPATWAAAAA